MPHNKTIEGEIADAVDAIAADVGRWTTDKKSADYTVKKLPVHLVVWPLIKKLSGKYDVAGAGDVITVRRRP